MTMPAASGSPGLTPQLIAAREAAFGDLRTFIRDGLTAGPGITTRTLIEHAQAAQPASMRPENGEDLAVAARDYQEAKNHLAHSQRILAREVANSVDAGMSVAEAARIAGVQRHTIYSWCFEAKR